MNADTNSYQYTVPVESANGWTLFVKCPIECSERLLRSTFDPYGNITSMECPLDRQHGGSQGFALVTFKDRKSAAQALRDLDEIEIAEGAGMLGVNWAYTQPMNDVDGEEELTSKTK